MRSLSKKTKRKELQILLSRCKNNHINGKSYVIPSTHLRWMSGIVVKYYSFWL